MVDDCDVVDQLLVSFVVHAALAGKLLVLKRFIFAAFKLTNKSILHEQLFQRRIAVDKL